ncbi:hypothetical protein CQA66_03205 [Helicobacter aurati]|uniref:Uncharacterized protein n=1 Tax=Helicobacter aurati TaxID=137778 RepID=A0A3D8J626_9HELI|nr:hypothetical protein [Helicobacter aurati]RDU72908.1 hypothetical protein CQA66_03205 [Helicobacter aurati]
MQIIIDSCHIIIAAVIALCLFVLILYRIQRGSRNLKVLAAVVFSLCVLSTTIYAFKQSSDTRRIAEFQKAFYADKVLTCNYRDSQIAIHKKHFIYRSDSFMFLGKDSHKGIAVNILDCESYQSPQNDEILTD